jgi:predicted RNA-binding Zn ribbon-like protein
MEDPPAPGDLALLERFVNTANFEEGTDELADAAGLTAWLAKSGLAPAGSTFGEPERERIVAFREALRELLLANHGDRPDPAAIAQLDRAGTLVVAFDADGTARLVPAEAGAEGVVGALLGIVARSQAEGTWPCMKACPADDCGWAFYDHSRNHSRTWCTMSICGNRAKARSYRARQR